MQLSSDLLRKVETSHEEQTCQFMILVLFHVCKGVRIQVCKFFSEIQLCEGRFCLFPPKHRVPSPALDADLLSGCAVGQRPLLAA